MSFETEHPYHQLMTRFMEAENVSSADVESASRDSYATVVA